MTQFLLSVCSSARRRLLPALTLAALAAGLWVTVAGRAQIPIDPDLGASFGLVVYDGEAEVGRVYRDIAGARYTEHWVLYGNYRFDQITRPGASIRIVAEKGEGYASVDDFLDNVPFPKGSRYVIARCEEFDDLP